MAAVSVKRSIVVYHTYPYPVVYSEARQRSTMGKKMKQPTHPRKFDNHVTVHRPSDHQSATQAYQCKITQSTGMTTQMQLEAILAGNRIATRVL